MKEISAGGVVYRRRGEQIEFQLIQDRYGKTSLAKGKMEPGETIEQTALREIREETGMEGSIVGKLDTIRYQYTSPEAGTVDKEVHYFLVEATAGQLTPQVEEIRSVEWYGPQAAWAKQTESGYDNNNGILSKAFAQLGITL
ncbi:NUDIX domain-containing protein [Paenibacillus thiaminolyticus]|uniref:NUDIX domain-containing protein n=1 Tax=Paenibacillus thiaminolyticus TaxID=49283 RepID=A0AAP9DY78_PANTH|nr:NUDIX domain-containing protein [Paenibacillus thiaminolyticus]MCY9533846.1 NUDIX domain-containing protein [Paenibacillus thiaminolyticus]MCY9601809.1 NUDIX domain-containing protein [Paenibacillus thiaminolyticus]MCY9607059.1 NUDIX domain-containing protein [Paenibacillus thiaminolyticus]MCY9614253.1 NUDIX domain-containing protein [Paenibacillus thiaminolyticus]MCY9619190.1 NUDIX domain-containing protein [Paenibacillus thiaminolyticus]